MFGVFIGCDFEVGVVDKDGKHVNVFEDATKKNPIIVEDYHITNDNGSLECAIPPFEFDPGNVYQLYDEVLLGIDILRDYLQERYPQYNIVRKDTLDTGKIRERIKGNERNIYSGPSTTEPVVIKDSLIYNGFHIHLSGIANRNFFIWKLDNTIGLFYKFLYPFSKRKIYGHLGTYKPKAYGFHEGFEYRVLGANMLKSLNLYILSIIFNRVVKKYHDF